MPQTESSRPSQQRDAFARFRDVTPPKEGPSCVEPKIFNDYGKLQAVLVAKTPDPITWFNDLVENPIHEHWVGKSKREIESSTLATAQHKAFVRFLQLQGIHVLKEEAPAGREGHQFLFPRDIAAVVGNKVLPARFRYEHRQGETVALDRTLASDSQLDDSGEYLLEGGDIAVYSNDLVFVGIGPRTNEAGLAHLRDHFPRISFHPVYIPEASGAYHLDTLLSFVNAHVAVAYQQLLDAATLELLQQKRVEIVPADTKEWMHCPTNVLAIEQGVVIASSQSERTNNRLRSIGVQVHELDLSEILKQGGGPHCLALPVQRVGY